MSSTGRASERIAHDNYPTPAWCVHRLLEAVSLTTGDWLEPSAGDGAIIRATRAERPGVNWHAVELRPECRAALHELVEPTQAFVGLDFLGGYLDGCDFDVVIGNPPFSHALAFVKASLRHAPWVAMLLRLNFLGSEERSSFLRTEQPDIYVLPNRPSFTGGGTDSIEYGWFVWTPQRGRRAGKVQVLESTPSAVRRADALARRDSRLPSVAA